MNTIKYNCERLLQTTLSPQAHSEEREKGLEKGQFSVFDVLLRQVEQRISLIFAALLQYRKIPKISPGAYIFQRPFLRGLFLEGLAL